MKKLMVLAAALAISGSAYAIDPVEDLKERVDGVYQVTCEGQRTDGGDNSRDWNFGKFNMDYLTFGIMSHKLLDTANNIYAKLGDSAIKAHIPNLPDGMPIDGVTR